MSWSKAQILNHRRAAQALIKIKDAMFELLSQKAELSEIEVQNFIKKAYKHHHLVSAPNKPIIAFRQNTAFVHYYPTSKNSKKIRPGSIILLDIWARLNKPNSPFADITWMAELQNKKSNGNTKSRKSAAQMDRVVKTVFAARDMCLGYLKKELSRGRLPTGQEVDKVARNFIHKQGFKNKFPHGTGHALGFNHPHGKHSPISPRGDQPLQKNLGYTIEPGIYLPGKFGARSEINFYISSNNKIVVTTPVQKKLSIL